MVSLQLTTQF